MTDRTEPFRVWANNLPTHRAYYSDRTAYLMALLCCWAYLRFEDAGPDELQARLGEVGLQLVGTFMHGGTEGFVAESQDLVVLILRGTTDDTDWRTNLRAKKLIHKERADGAPVFVHQGFSEAWRGVEGEVQSLLDETGGKPVYIAGHSLGGAVAVIASALLESDRIAAVYTFGAPRVGNRTFDLYVKPPHYRVVNGWDVVPLVPATLMRYNHGGDPRYIQRGVTDVARWNRPKLRALGVLLLAGVTFPFTRRLNGIRDHAIELYAAILRPIAETRAGPPPEPASRPRQVRSSPPVGAEPGSSASQGRPAGMGGGATLVAFALLVVSIGAWTQASRPFA